MSLGVKPVGEPDAGKPHVRFDERGAETERLACLSETPTRKGGNGRGSHGLYRHRAAPRLYRRLSKRPVPGVRRLIGCIIGRPVRPSGGDWPIRGSFHGGMLAETAIFNTLGHTSPLDLHFTHFFNSKNRFRSRPRPMHGRPRSTRAARDGSGPGESQHGAPSAPHVRRS